MSSRPKPRTLISTLLILVLLGKQGQPKALAQVTGIKRVRPAASASSQASQSEGHPVSGATVLVKPFIRPIAPMGPLFAHDSFFQAPWSEAGSPLRSVTHRGGLAAGALKIRSLARLTRDEESTAPSNMRAGPQSDRFPSLPFADNLTPLGRLVYERPRALVMSQHPAASDRPPIDDSYQSTMSPARASQIQAALAQVGYLTAPPNGMWSGASIIAMRKFQSDHHWQTKFVPDARALILLGLGPGSHAL